MRRLVLFTVAAALCPVGFMGCAEKTSVEKKTEVTTPGGTTQTKTETETKKSGDNPPPPATNP